MKEAKKEKKRDAERAAAEEEGVAYVEEEVGILLACLTLNPYPYPYPYPWP